MLFLICNVTFLWSKNWPTRVAVSLLWEHFQLLVLAVGTLSIVHFVSSIVEAAQKLIFPTRTKKQRHGLKIRMDLHGVHKVRVSRKSLATSSSLWIWRSFGCKFLL